MKRLFLFLMILALAMGVGAKTVYVDGDTGSDSNTGLSPSHAMATFDNALDLCSPRDCIVMYNYQEDLADADVPYDMGGISMKGYGDTWFDAKNVTSGETIIFRINISSTYAYNMEISGITFKNTDTTPEFVGKWFIDTGTFSTSYPYQIIVDSCDFLNCGSIASSTDYCFYFLNAGPKWGFFDCYAYDSMCIVRASSYCWADYGRNQFYNNVYEASVVSRYSGVNTVESTYGGEFVDNVFIRMEQGIAAHASVVPDTILNHENNNVFYLVTTPIYVNGSRTIDATSHNGTNPLVTGGCTANNSPIWDWTGSGAEHQYIGRTQRKVGLMVN